jgi:hypothetical protein
VIKTYRGDELVPYSPSLMTSDTGCTNAGFDTNQIGTVIGSLGPLVYKTQPRTLRYFVTWDSDLSTADSIYMLMGGLKGADRPSESLAELAHSPSKSASKSIQE